MAEDFYAVLDVDADSDSAEVKAAFRRRARRFHPDVNDHPRASDQFTVLSTARDVLLDPDERALYDELGHEAYVSEHLPRLPDPPMSPDDDDEATVAEAAVDSSAREMSTATRANGGLASRFSPGRTRPSGVSSGSAGPRAAPRPGSDETKPSRAGEAEASPDGGAAESGVSWERARRRQAARQERTRGHLSASFNWVPIVLSAVLYGFGLGRYLRVNREALSGALSALAGGDVLAIHARGSVTTMPAFAEASGLRMQPDPSFGLVLVMGAAALALVTTWSVWELRQRTNWSPSWLHCACAAGPLASLVAGVALPRVGAPIGVPSVPLWLDLGLLVVLPGLAVFSFLVNRFVLVLPLVRT